MEVYLGKYHLPEYFPCDENLAEELSKILLMPQSFLTLGIHIKIWLKIHTVIEIK